MEMPRRQAPQPATRTLRWLAVLVVSMLSGHTAAAPPPDADPALGPWFRDLRAPDTGRSCCSVSDCRATEVRTNGDRYEAYIEGQWLPVPQAKVLSRPDNPTGHAVVCWTPALGIMCFIPGPGV